MVLNVQRLGNEGLRLWLQRRPAGIASGEEEESSGRVGERRADRAALATIVVAAAEMTEMSVQCLRERMLCASPVPLEGRRCYLVVVAPAKNKPPLRRGSALV